MVSFMVRLWNNCDGLIDLMSPDYIIANNKCRHRQRLTAVETCMSPVHGTPCYLEGAEECWGVRWWAWLSASPPRPGSSLLGRPSFSMKLRSRLLFSPAPAAAPPRAAPSPAAVAPPIMVYMLAAVPAHVIFSSSRLTPSPSHPVTMSI